MSREESRQNAEECAKHPETRWYCDKCAVHVIKDNTITRQRCLCGRWMKWSYPVEVT